MWQDDDPRRDSRRERIARQRAAAQRRRSRQRRTRPVIAGLILIVLGLVFWHFEYGTERTVTFTVKSLDDQARGSSHTYLVFTTDDHVYKNTDAWFHGKTDSSNIQGWLTAGHTYTRPVYGWRLFFFSSYPDLLDGCTDITPRIPAAQRHVP